MGTLITGDWISVQPFGKAFLPYSSRPLKKKSDIRWQWFSFWEIYSKDKLLRKEKNDRKEKSYLVLFIIVKH